MIKKFITATCLAFAASSQVQAATQVYAFTATVTSVGRAEWGYKVEELTGTEGPDGGPRIELGQRIVGRFSFDDQPVFDDIWVNSDGDVFRTDWTNGSLSYTFVSTNTTFTSDTWLHSTNYKNSIPFQDNFILYGDNPTSAVWFDDATRTRFANGVPVGALALGGLSRAELGAAWRRTDGEYVDFDARLDTLTMVAVPEPESWALMLGGLALVGATARRRRSAA